jgi:hypothetical protein
MSSSRNISSFLDSDKSKKLEELLDDLPQALEQKRKIRDNWYEWHSQWKKAWLEENPSNSDDSIQNLKEITTIKKRKF